MIEGDAFSLLERCAAPQAGREIEFESRRGHRKDLISLRRAGFASCQAVLSSIMSP